MTCQPLFDLLKNHVGIIVQVITASAILITAIATLIQARRLKTSLQFETLSRIVERFENNSYQEKRKSAALTCLKNLKKRKPGVEVEDVLDFFDEVAFLVRSGVLTKKMVWHEFYHWVRLYWQAAGKYVIERRLEEPAVWEDLYWLYPKLNDIEKKKYPCHYKEKLTEKDLKKFLKEEF